jgi:hypothetical protein
MDGMRGQYSSVSIPSFWCLLCHVYTVKSIQREQAGSRDSSKEDSGELYILYMTQAYSSLLMIWAMSAAAAHNDCHNTVMCFHFCESLYCGLRNSLWYGLHLEEDDLKAYSLYVLILFA